jgi:hypothetical protein
VHDTSVQARPWASDEIAQENQRKSLRSAAISGRLLL